MQSVSLSPDILGVIHSLYTRSVSLDYPKGQTASHMTGKSGGVTPSPPKSPALVAELNPLMCFTLEWPSCLMLQLVPSRCAPETIGSDAMMISFHYPLNSQKAAEGKRAASAPSVLGGRNTFDANACNFPYKVLGFFKSSFRRLI